MDELHARCSSAIGSLDALAPAATSSGNPVSDEDQRAAGRAGSAVGDICLRFFDIDGMADRFAGQRARDRGEPLEQLARVDRLIGVAGGPRKYEAIRAALRGRLVNVLITDHVTAERLLADRPASDVAAADAAAAS